MLIRPFVSTDADQLADLYHASIHEVGIKDYSVEQVWAWSPSKPDPEKYLSRAGNRTLLVALNDGGEPVGYGDLEPNGHIDHLYCRPDAVGMGVGSAILAALESVAKNAGVVALFVEASEGARHLFERRGFDLELRNDFTIRGVSIHNYRMSKSIA